MRSQLFDLPGHLLLATVISCSVLFWFAASGFGQERPEVLIVAEDYQFSGPDQIAPGWHTIRLQNQGHDTHHVQFLKLSAGKTAKDFNEALAADSTQLPSWVVRYGGVNSVMPGKEATAMLDLDPGEYVLICGIPDKRGRPHVIQGMSKALKVTEGEEAARTAPSPTLTLFMKEFSYSFDRPMTAGEQQILVRNDGREAHEVLLLSLEPGASVVDFLEFYRPGIPDNPAGRTIGGVTGLAPGRVAILPLKVEPGRYGILCFLADPIRRRPHFMEGMWMDIDVPGSTPPATP